MIRRMSLSAMALAIVLPLSTLSVRAADDNLDKKVLEIVKKTGDLYKDAKTLHVDSEVVSKIEQGGESKELKVSAVYDVAKPSQFAVRTKVDGDASKGPDVITTGKKTYVYRKSMKQYTEEDGDKPLSETGMSLMRDSTQVGMLFANIMGDDPADLLMQGVTSCSLVGEDKIDGKPVHRMKFSQPEFDWELWVASEGKPYILRMVSTRKGGDNSVTTTETYKNWKIDEKPAKDAFTFTAPKDATKVDDFGGPK